MNQSNMYMYIAHNGVAQWRKMGAQFFAKSEKQKKNQNG